MFGDIATFAVEAEFVELYGKRTYGRLRFWLNGVPVGDFDDTSDLATSARWGRTFLAASSRRTRAELGCMAADEVYELLYGRFVEPINTTAPKPWPGPWDRDPYVLDEVGESSLRDKFSVLVVRRGDGADRILIKCFDEERLLEACLSQGACDRVIASYCEWVEKLRPLPS